MHLKSSCFPLLNLADLEVAEYVTSDEKKSRKNGLLLQSHFSGYTVIHILWIFTLSLHLPLHLR